LKNLYRKNLLLKLLTKRVVQMVVANEELVVFAQCEPFRKPLVYI